MIYFLAAIILLCIWLFKNLPIILRTRRTLEQEIGALKAEVELWKKQTNGVLSEYKTLGQDFEKLQYQSKSSQVRTGFLAEAVLPLHESFPVDPKTMRFLGSPIDYISFCYETNTITFVEVKTGDSQLNENQRAVKKMVEEGRVEFKIVRLNEKGLKVK
jgi:predicted Holliday junction resolvase-like endonuclease